MKRKLLALFLVVAMLCVSLFAGLTTAGAENGAKAAASNNIYTYYDMENYKDGELVASYDKDADPAFFTNGTWRADTLSRTIDGGETKVTLNATTEKAHTGNVSLVANASNKRFYGFKMTGLKAATNYTVSFFAYIEGEETETPFYVDSTYVFPKFIYNGSQMDFINSKGNRTSSPTLGRLYTKVDATNKWARVEVQFHTRYNESTIDLSFVDDVYVWFSFTGDNTKLYVDDVAVYTPYVVEHSAGFGGKTTSNIPTDNAVPGEEVVFTAEPYEGNTFVNWTDVNGQVVSTDKEFKFTATGNCAYVANFDGPNKPSVDVLAERGYDGTFESYDSGYTVPQWIVPVTGKGSADWYNFQATDLADASYEEVGLKPAVGQKVMAAHHRWKDANFTLKGLLPNTNYRLSFYVNVPDSKGGTLSQFFVTDTQTEFAASVSSTLAYSRKVQINSGWVKVDLCFNTGLKTSARLIYKFSSDNSGKGGLVYFDDMHLYAINATEELPNGDFENGIDGWYGDANAAVDGGKNVLKLDADKTAFTEVAIKNYKPYEVTFKAKGKGTVASLDLGKAEVNSKNYITSVSSVEVDSADWKEYTYRFYSVNNNAFRLAFEAAAGGMLVDDVALKVSDQVSGAYVEMIDFESERFELANADSAYSIVEEEDGNKALKFTYDPADKNTHIFSQHYLSYQAPFETNLRISFRYKIAGGKTGGGVLLAPEYSGQYGAEVGFEHSARDDKWQTVVFYASNTSHAAFNLRISASSTMTFSDVYIDDISITLTPPMVLLESTKNTYCEELYNAVKNSNFEKEVTDKDWVNLPSTAKIVTGDALKGSHFLRASAGTHYVIPVNVKAGVNYTFAASIRGDAKSAGYVGITVNASGTDFYVNRDEVPCSRIEFNKENTGWERTGFKFAADTSGIVYLVVHVDSGSLDFDSLMMFTDEYSYRYDPNDYTVYVPYDYDNLKSSTTVINGGFGEQPYYKPTNK